MAELTHIDSDGRVRMVDVTGKAATHREAVARGTVRMKSETLAMIRSGTGAKGNVLETARIAGVMAAKRTSELIPMCHPLLITHVRIDFSAAPPQALHITAAARTQGQTGVEMEALSAVAVAALTVYDMCKAVDRSMEITDIVLDRKTGGKSGTYNRKPDSNASDR
jgi:cyclic pyranopterin phosphate synthase